MSALPALALNVGANRVVKGIRIEHVCGDPSLAEEADMALSHRIIATALRALQAEVSGPTLFEAS
jgi:glycine/betaine/sarcosine/D-proline reductase family selenoprotein B